MQKIPVTRDGKRGSQIFTIDSDQVIKIDKIRDKTIILHTKTDQFFFSMNFEIIEEWLYEDGFRMIDSSNLVNMKQISHYDPKKGIIYFDDPLNIHGKTASASWIHRDHIENVLELLKITKTPNETDSGTASDEKDFSTLLKSLSKHEDNERFLRSYITIHAMAERKKAEEKIVHMAFHDALTNLPNRLMFNEHLKSALKDSENTDKLAAIIFLDLDRFKNINDTLGHQVGDELLKFIAGKLKDLAETTGNLIARFGGDEFILLMSNIVHIDEVTHFTKRILKLFSQPFVYQTQELYMTASTGISIFPTNGSDANTLIQYADTAMYRAKEKGGNTYQLYHSGMNTDSLERLNLEAHLRKALEKLEIEVHYQPLIELHSGRIFGMEALVRWNHNEWGMMGPGKFIPLAEETGLIVPIGNWVLRKACEQTKQWQNQGFPHLSISVNISANQIEQPSFIRYVEDVLMKTGLSAQLLCLEITENIAMKNITTSIETMRKLKELGIRISIDDFGTGYSSLSYLKQFQVNTLKIDRTFIKDISTDEDNAAIVTALIAMSRQLKIRSLAEGVETREQLEFLKSSGCDQIQGYFFSKPLPAHQFESLLKQEQERP